MSKTTTNERSHSDGIYTTAFEAYCDAGHYSEVARQMGVSAATAKRWVRRGGDIWRREHADEIQRAIGRQGASAEERAR